LETHKYRKKYLFLGVRVNTGAIVLADGKSKETGQNKLLQRSDGNTSIKSILDTLSDAGISDQVVVVGDNMAEVIDAIRPKLGKIKIALNIAPEKGMASSIQTGIIVLSNVDAIFVVWGDQPFFDSGLVKRMVETMESNPEVLIVIPVQNKKEGDALLFRKSLLDELMSLKDNQTVSDITQTHSDKIATVETRECKS
jgi:CTP:molybdopterin cytidylyltransferase MocA